MEKYGSIKVSKKTLLILNKMKYEYGYKNMDEIINKVLDIIPSLEIQKRGTKK